MFVSAVPRKRRFDVYKRTSVVYQAAPHGWPLAFRAILMTLVLCASIAIGIRAEPARAESWHDAGLALSGNLTLSEASLQVYGSPNDAIFGGEP